MTALHVFSAFVIAAMLTWIAMLARLAFNRPPVTFYVLSPAGAAFVVVWAAVFLLIHRSAK